MILYKYINVIRSTSKQAPNSPKPTLPSAKPTRKIRQRDLTEVLQHPARCLSYACSRPAARSIIGGKFRQNAATQVEKKKKNDNNIVGNLAPTGERGGEARQPAVEHRLTEYCCCRAVT